MLETTAVNELYRPGAALHVATSLLQHAGIEQSSLPEGAMEGCLFSQRIYEWLYIPTCGINLW